MMGSWFTFVVASALLAACGETPRGDFSTTNRAIRAPHKPETAPVPNAEPPPRLLAIEWGKVPLATEQAALAVWALIAPTGADWSEKLDEVPTAATRPLAVALLRGGNFTCMPAPSTAACAPPQFDVDAPTLTATFAEPCLRRLLALWAIEHLEPADLPTVTDALRAIVTIPPPESQLVAAALAAVPDANSARQLELIGRAIAAGQHEVVDASLSRLDEPALITAATVHHAAGALEVLSATGHRAVYIGAVTDAQLPAAARIAAITELLTVDTLQDPPVLGADLRAALGKATAAADCSVAAVAVRALVATGTKSVLPKRGKTPAAMLRALCVLASYERLTGADEPSLLQGFVPARGLERVAIAYDPLSDTDEDGDGNLHTIRRVDLVPRAEVSVPEIEDVIRAMTSCTGTICRSASLEVRFGFRAGAGGLVLARLELAQRPPCPARPR